MKFKADFNGSITGIRFYKASTNTGTHIGSLWTTTGTLLAPGDVHQRDAPPAGSRSTFASPVAITAGTTYVASYFAPSGHYSRHQRRPRDRPSTTRRCTRSPTRRAPTASTPTARRARSRAARYNARNYWVDVAVRASRRPGQVTGVTAATAGQRSADVSLDARPRAAARSTRYKVTPYIGSTAQTPTTVTGTPPATSKTVTGLTTGTTYTFTVQAVNANGAGPGVRAVQRGHAARRRWRPRRPTGVTARPATTSALVSWTRAHSDGDSAITGYTVTPYIGADGADAGPGRRVGDEQDDHRADQRHRLHVQGHRDQRRRHRPGVGGLERRSRPQAHDPRLRHAGDGRRAATPTRSSSA